MILKMSVDTVVFFKSLFTFLTRARARVIIYYCHPCHKTILYRRWSEAADVGQAVKSNLGGI